LTEEQEEYEYIVSCSTATLKVTYFLELFQKESTLKTENFNNEIAET